jgi:hypothetical protein
MHVPTHVDLIYTQEKKGVTESHMVFPGLTKVESVAYYQQQLSAVNDKLAAPTLAEPTALPNALVTFTTAEATLACASAPAMLRSDEDGVLPPLVCRLAPEPRDLLWYPLLLPPQSLLLHNHL